MYTNQDTWSASGPNTFSVIPLPAHITPMEGAFWIDADTPLVHDPSAADEAYFLACQIRELLSATLGPAVVKDPLGRHIALVLDSDCKHLGAEGYRLSISTVRVTISAAETTGIFYGIQSLLQLMPVRLNEQNIRESNGFDIPCVEIEDKPRFPWRGVMLDVARHFLPAHYVLKFIDLLAMHKINVLHLHLTDDQGWRIEIKKYPKLAAVGGFRGRTLVGRAFVDPADEAFDPSVERFDNIPHTGYYTQQEARSIVEHARKRHITVVPEIEMPGHAQAAIAAYPLLGCTGEQLEVSPRWGIHDSIFNPSETTIGFLHDVLAEIMDIFPSRFIHIGGDEAVKRQWETNSDSMELKSRLALADEEAVQSYFMDQVGELLCTHGRRLVGWDELLHGKLCADAVIMAWQGTRGTDSALSGYDTVMCPENATYLDHYQTDDYRSEPLAFHGDSVTLPMVYNFDPVPTGLPAEAESHILGAQAQIWTEYMPTSRQVEYMTFPRLCALSEAVWSSCEHKNYDAFLQRLRYHLTRLDASDVNYRPLEREAEK